MKAPVEVGAQREDDGAARLGPQGAPGKPDRYMTHLDLPSS